jgi:hypothetical protein
VRKRIALSTQAVDVEPPHGLSVITVDREGADCGRWSGHPDIVALAIVLQRVRPACVPLVSDPHRTATASAWEDMPSKLCLVFHACRAAPWLPLLTADGEGLGPVEGPPTARLTRAHDQLGRRVPGAGDQEVSLACDVNVSCGWL